MYEVLPADWIFFSKSSFQFRVVRHFVQITSIAIIAAVFSRGTLLFEIIFFSIVFLSGVLYRYTYSVAYLHKFKCIEIVYYEFSFRKILRIDLNEVNITLKKKYAFRYGPYSVLQISKDDKRLYEIDSRDIEGFEDLHNSILNLKLSN
ncbi:MAG TPA: hypothetical protein VHK91_02900 [Flavisolibacter sp.]|jgi:hypothetical protein|nr:hypothetical protein [Flavisolibacter sp.]